MRRERCAQALVLFFDLFPKFSLTIIDPVREMKAGDCRTGKGKAVLRNLGKALPAFHCDQNVRRSLSRDHLCEIPHALVE